MKKRVPAYDGVGSYAFVSYSHKDSKTVYKIIEQLASMGYNLWYDEGIPLVSDYGGVLYDRIKKCSVFVLFVSKSSVKSDDVEKEASHAISFKKPIVQIVIDEKAELPASIAYHLPKNRQYLSVKAEKGEFYKKLAAALDMCGEPSGAGTAEHDSGRKSLKVGDKITMGNCVQNGTEAEPIEWRVLKVESDRVLVISEYAIDNLKYNENWITGTKWEDCTLRKWLNDWFPCHAFSEEEYENILNVKVSHPKNPKFGTVCGFSTEDRIFCLSAEEAEEYFANDEQRVTVSTKYAERRGATAGTTCWWLRTLGKTASSAMFVNRDGKMSEFGIDVSDKHISVRPAMYIKL